MRRLRDPHSAWEAKVPNGAALIGTLKDLPLRAVPFIIFPGATGVFGELLLRVPETPTIVQMVTSWVLALFTVVAGGLFFTKCFFGWPPMHGLDLKD
jgi:hypothetical protein